MSYPYGNPPYGNPYGYPQPYGQPNMMGAFMCQQSVGLGGKSQVIPVNYPINMQYVAQQVQMYLMSQGFNVFPMVGQNMVVIQAQHNSLLGSLTDRNQAYTIRICQGQGMVVVETGIANLLQDLLVAGGTAAGSYFIGDDMLHNKLLEILGGGATAFDAYNMYKEYANEEQLLNIITMAVMNAPPMQQYPMSPPAGAPMYPQGPYPQQQPYPYSQPYQQPPQSYPYSQPPQQQLSQQQVKPTIQNVKCWKCGAENEPNSKFCSSCGASLEPVKCPKCNTINEPGAKYCSNCGYQLIA